MSVHAYVPLCHVCAFVCLHDFVYVPKSMCLHACAWESIYLCTCVPVSVCACRHMCMSLHDCGCALSVCMCMYMYMCLS